MRFFTYAYYRPGEEAPFYVGKGCGKRHLDHLAIHKRGQLKYNQFFNSSLRKLEESGQEPVIKQLEWFENEEAAYEQEERLIAQYGRRVDGSGILDNIDPGFRRRIGFKGKKHSEETKNKMRRPRTEATRQRMSKPKSPEHTAKLRKVAQQCNSQTCTWELRSPGGDIMLVENLNQFCLVRGLNPTTIYRSLDRGAPVARGKSSGWMALSKKKHKE